MKTQSQWIVAALALAFFQASDLARAQSTERASVDSTGVQGNGISGFIGAGAGTSADGRYVAFESSATNLVPNDTNGRYDIFVRDRVLGTTTIVSVDSNGVQGNGDSHLPVISADGRFVAFRSQASNLVPNDTNGFYDIFVRDLQNSTTERVSVDSSGAEANGNCFAPKISADGRFVAFYSAASTLVPGDTNGTRDVFVHDRQTGITERVSVDSNGAQATGNSENCGLSDDGRYVVFDSTAANLVAGDTNGTYDIFLHDRQTGTTERVSVDSSGAQVTGNSQYPACSSDARFVAFHSFATTLVAGDTNGVQDIFVRDRTLGTTVRVSVDSTGVESNGTSQDPSISDDGRYVAFQSLATNLVASDTNGVQDLFVHDRLLGTTERVSVDSTGLESNDTAQFPCISSDGRYVAFQSTATNLVPNDTNGVSDIFLRDRGAPPALAMCFGDGTGAQCPCGNNGLPGSGCDNSSATGGAVLYAGGSSTLSNDTLVLNSSAELPHALSIFLQGNTLIAAVNFGDGLRCAAGLLKRLYIHNAVNGIASAPATGDLSISARSAALGDPIGAGTLRYYQTYYRDPILTFCPNPPGNSWNISSGLSVSWVQ